MTVTCRARACLVVLVVAMAACDVRQSRDYKRFTASHDGIRPGMSMREVFNAGLADYLIASGGKNVPGGTVPAKQPVSPDCRRYVVDIHSGGGGFSLTVYCNMNGPSDRQVVPTRVFSANEDLGAGLDASTSWMKSASFRVESPPLKVGGVYDSYEFSLDENARVADVSPLRMATLH